MTLLPISRLVSCLAALTLASCATRRQLPPSEAGPPAAVASSGALSSAQPLDAPVPSALAVVETPRSFDAVEAARTACVDDPMCSREALAKLIADAADRGGVTDCALFYYGVAVSKDWERARACFARKVASEPACSGSSPSLDQNLLATMLFDGQGGPKDANAAHAVFAGCFEDASVQWIFDAPSPRAPGPLDFCKDIGGTTLSMAACASQAIDLDTLGRLLIRKDLAGRMGREALAKEDRAFKTFLEFTSAAAAVSADRFRGGTLATDIFPGEVDGLVRSRNDWLATLAGPLRPRDNVEKARAVRDHDRALAKALAGADTERAKLLHEGETAFTAYRRAEAAFLREALTDVGAGAAATEAEVRATDAWTGVMHGLDD